MANKCMLSTKDNPFNPFVDFTKWYSYDMEKQYYSCAKLAKIAKTSDSLTEEENDEEIERAIDEIIKYDFLDVYIKVVSNN